MIRTAADAERLLNGLEYKYDTQIGKGLEKHVLQPLVYDRMSWMKDLPKPVLIITVTDGEPSDNPKDLIVQKIQECRHKVSKKYGPKAVAFQFAQVSVRLLEASAVSSGGMQVWLSCIVACCACLCMCHAAGKALHP